MGIRINVLDDCWVVKGLKLRNVLSIPGSSSEVILLHELVDHQGN